MFFKRRNTVIVEAPVEEVDDSELLQSVEDLEPEKAANVLKIVVLRARKLKAMDRSLLGRTALSDPYVVLDLDGETCKTSVVKKCLDPTWNEHFALSADERFTLRCTVKDYDFGSADDVIGKVDVKIDDRKPHRAWHKLGDNLGEIELLLQWGHDPKFHYHLPVIFNVPEPPKKKKKRKKHHDDNDDNKKKKLPKKDEEEVQPSKAKPPNELHVYLIRAKGLVASSSAYAIIRVNDESKKTKIVEKPTNPVFEEHVIYDDVEDKATKIDILVVGARDKFLGRRVLIFDDVILKGQTRRGYFDLEDENGNKHAKRGRIEVAVLWRHNPDLVVDCDLPTEDPMSSEPANELSVALLRGRKLKAMDNGKTSDPYAVVELRIGSDVVKHTSSVKSKTLTPIWQEKFHYDLEEDDIATAKLTVTLYDKDTFGKDDFMGTVDIDLKSSSLETKRRRRFWAILHGGDRGTFFGQVDVGLLWHHNPSKFIPLPPEFTDTKSQEQRNKLVGVLIRGRRLKACDKNFMGGESSDPFAVIRCLGCEWKSRTISKTLKPLWNDCFEFPCEFNDASIEFTLYDADMASRDFMGQACIPFPRTFGHRKWYKLHGKDDDDNFDYGAVELAFHWVHDPTLVMPLPAELLGDQKDGPKNEIAVAVLRAKNLPIADRNLLDAEKGSSDPFCKLTWHSFTAETKTINKNVNPTFGDVLTFPAEDVADFDDALTLAVHDRGLTANVLLGQASFDLTALTLDNVHVKRRWLRLRTEDVVTKKKKSRRKSTTAIQDCRLECAAVWRHNRSLVYAVPEDVTKDEEWPDLDANALTIVLLRGRQLPIKDKHRFKEGGTSDPYCVFKVAGEEVQSKVVKKSVNPDFGAQRFEIPSEDIHNKLEVLVLDDGMFRSQFMGRFEVPMLKLEDREPHRSWYDVRDQGGAGAGRIELVLRWHHNPDLVLDTPSEMRMKEKHPEMPPNELMICLVRARNLPAMDIKTDSCDPFASMTLINIEKTMVKTKILKSTVKKKTRYPIWLERFDLFIDRSDCLAATVLHLDLADYDGPLAKTELIGRVQVPMLTLSDRRVHRDWYTIEDVEKKNLGEVEVVLRLVYNAKSKHSYYDVTSAADLEKISATCIKAIEDRDMERLRLLIARGASCRHVIVDEAKRNAAHFLASRDAGEDLLDLLWKLFVDLDGQDKNGVTPAMIAASENRPLFLRKLAILGADLEISDKYGARATHYAAKSGADRSLRILVALGTNLDEETIHGRTPMHVAAQFARVATLETLAALGADINQTGTCFGNRVPLHEAALIGDLPTIAKCIALGATVDFRDTLTSSTPAHLAAMNGNKMALEFLRSKGANLDLLDDQGKSPSAYIRIAVNSHATTSRSGGLVVVGGTTAAPRRCEPLQ